MKFYKIGTIVNTHGIKGEVKIVSNTDFEVERFSSGNKLYIEEKQVVTIKNARNNNGSWIVLFQEFNNINEVEAFKGKEIFVKDEDRLELEDDDFYYDQIIGLDVFDLNNNKIGVIQNIISLPSNDVWSIKGVKEYLIPYTEQVVKEVDLVNKKIIIDAIEGLLE